MQGLGLTVEEFSGRGEDEPGPGIAGKKTGAGGNRRARAARLPRPGHGGDLHDLAFLIRHTGTKSIVQIDEIFAQFYGDSLDNRQRLVAERALEIAYEPRHPTP